MPSRRKVPTPAGGADAGSSTDDAILGATQEPQAGLFQTLFEQAAAGLVVVDVETLRILQVNAQFCAIIGCPPEELIGRPIEAFVSPEDVAAHLETRDLFKATGELPLPRREKRYRRRDGSTIWVRITASLLRDAQGEPMAAVGVVEDITERKRLEEQARANEGRYRTIVQTANEGIWQIDLAARTLYVNERLAGWLGYRVEEMLGSTVLEFTFPEDVAEAQARIGSNLQGHFEQFDFRFRRRDGRELPVLACTSPVRDAEGQISGALGMFTDLTERRRLERDATVQQRALQGAYEEVLASQTRFQRLTESGIIGVLVADMERILEANDTFLSMIGATREELDAGAIRWREMTPPAYASLDEQAIEQMLATGQFMSFEKAYRRKDGSLVPILIGGALLEREPMTCVCFVLDLTERKRLERELAEQTALLETAFSAMTEGVLLYDRTGKALRMNPTARQMLGVDATFGHLAFPLADRTTAYAIRDMNGQTVPPEQWPVARILRGEIIPSDQTVDMQVKTPDGREYIGNFSGSPLRSQTGEIIGAVVISRDVTERRQLEQRTQKSLEALLQMAHTLAQPAVDARQTSEARSSARISALLRHLAELSRQVLGCERLNMVLLQPETETLEPLVMVGISPEQEQVWRERMRGLALSAYLTQETIDQLKAGEPVLVGSDQRLLPIQTPSLEIAQFLIAPLRAGKTLLGGMSLDYGADHHFLPDELALAQALGNLVTLVLEREQLALASRQARQQVETLEQEKAERETFISLVAHELRTPLTVISGQAQLLERSASMNEARRAETIHKIRVQTRRLQRLIDDLLDVSRIASGTFEIAPELTDLTALATSVVEEQQATTQRHRVRLEAPSAPLIGMWDRLRLSQVLSNLLSNAIKYSEGGEVVVRLQRAEDGVQVVVQDQGAGMTAEEIGQLFQLYSRLARTRKVAGNGLGLYLTRGIIEAHGGRIWASSPGPGQGSAFTFTLPLRRDVGLAP